MKEVAQSRVIHDHPLPHRDHPIRAYVGKFSRARKEELKPFQSFSPDEVQNPIPSLVSQEKGELRQPQWYSRKDEKAVQRFLKMVVPAGKIEPRHERGKQQEPLLPKLTNTLLETAFSEFRRVHPGFHLSENEYDITFASLDDIDGIINGRGLKEDFFRRLTIKWKIEGEVSGQEDFGIQYLDDDFRRKIMIPQYYQEILSKPPQTPEEQTTASYAAAMFGFAMLGSIIALSAEKKDVTDPAKHLDIFQNEFAKDVKRIRESLRSRTQLNLSTVKPVNLDGFIADFNCEFASIHNPEVYAVGASLFLRDAKSRLCYRTNFSAQYSTYLVFLDKLHMKYMEEIKKDPEISSWFVGPERWSVEQRNKYYKQKEDNRKKRDSLNTIPLTGGERKTWRPQTVASLDSDEFLRSYLTSELAFRCGQDNSMLWKTILKNVS